MSAKLMKKWEDYRNIRHKETENLTMADETKLFVTKLLQLKDILLYLKGHKFAEPNLEQLYTLQVRLDKLQKNVEIEGTLNAGGKFEWFDSILIKCLQDGCWLLIENVNLCSPAVLDRLNALLEPNGMLTIGERGVDENGEMINIIPHPNFRLFLTMDPKNGEISRAMRNRGVEIYMLNGIESGDRNEFDTKAMIEQNGLNVEGFQDILLTLHDYISQIVLGEKPIISNMLQASFLISQQLLRGINIVDAFTSSLIDVYVKTKSIHDFTINDPINTIESYIKSTVEDYLIQNDGNSRSFDHKTIKTMDLQTDSYFEIVKQQNVLIQSINQDKLTYHLLLSYFITSNNNLKLRYSFLMNELKNMGKEFGTINENLFSTLNDYFKKNALKNNKDMPLDSLWLMDTNEKYTNLYESNQIFLLLHFLISKTLTESQLSEDIEKKFTKLTVLQYSKAVLNKKLSRYTIDHPLIINFYKLIIIFDDYLTTVLTTQNLKLNSENTIFASLVVNWRFALQEIGNLIVYDKTNKKLNLNTVLSQLIVRYKWFIKHTVEYFKQLSNPEQGKHLKNIIDLIASSVENNFSNFSKIAKRFMKNSLKPLPLSNEEQINILSSLEEIVQQTSLTSRNNYSLQTKCFIAINEPEFNQTLIETRKEVRENIVNKERVNELKEYINKSTNKEIKLTEVQLLPVKDFFAVQIISNIRNCIFSPQSKNSTWTNEKCQTLRKLTTVPSELNEILETYFKTRSEKLLPELTLLKTIYLRNAISLSPSNYLSWNTNEESLKTFSSHVPALTYSVTNLCVSSNGNNDLVSVTKLGKYKERSEQLKFLNELLWQNIPAFSSDKYNFIKNDSEYIINSFEKFIILLEKSLTGQNTDVPISKTINICIEKINEIYSSNTETEEMMKNKEKVMNIFNQLCQQVDKLKSATDLNILIHTANVYCLLNYIKALFNSQLQIIDPLEKNVLKKKHCEDQRRICTDMKEAIVAQNTIYSEQSKTLHPFYDILCVNILKYVEKERELEKLIVVRPNNISYQSLLKDVAHNLSTLLSDDFFVKMHEKVNNCIIILQEALKNKTKINLEESNDALSQSTSWIYSQQNSFAKLYKYRVGYPDIVEDLLSNITELSYGIKLLNTVLQKLVIRYENMHQDLNKFMQNLVQFPVLNDSQKSVFNLIELCTENKNVNFVSETIDNEEIPNIVKQENLRMLKCGIQEMFNLFVTNSPIYVEPQNKMLVYLENLINLFVSTWYKQESDRQKKVEEEQSLYKTKSKCDNLTEEEEANRDMKLLFPNFHELDFSDFQNKQLGDTPEEPYLNESEFVGVITNDDVKFVAHIHSELMQLYTKSEWLNPKKKNLEPNFITPLLERYKVFSLLQNKLIDGLDNNIETVLISSLNLLVSITKHNGEGEDIFAKINSSPRKTKEKSYDFYKDSNVEEVKSCLHIVEALKKRITELLNEWPSHPTLQSIEAIIDRIYSFPITSSVSRFLTGLEILLSKNQEWEENAHAGVSLQEYSQNLTLQVIAWRKLELAGWKDCLNNAFDRVKNSVSKWWFHIYSSINEFIESKKSDVTSPQQLIKLFQEFIEKSPLGEYESRLDLLFTFHCHTLHLPKSENKDIVVSILWNLFHYYAQFITNVDTKIKNLRTPIEKKLKDFVKIARWNDINYWSVKETVEKTHRNLHKYIKEFENVLKQSVTECLVNSNTETSSSEQVGIWDRPTRYTPSQYHYSLEPSNYMASVKFKKLITNNTVSIEKDEPDSLLSKTEKYFSKSRNLCKDIILTTSYPSLIQNLDSFITEIIETSNHLRNLEVNRELDKKKQKSQAKSILQQKRKALADLFKTLAKCGLSYRTGIIETKLRDSSAEFLLKPLDLNASFAHMKNKGACDKQLLNVWDGCETYFMRTISRLTGLDSALKQPAQDLGLPNIERCKGFSAHLMILAQDQKAKLIETTRNLYYLRNCVNLLSDWDDESEIVKIETVKSVSNLLTNIIIVMEQCKLVLLSCPDQPHFETDVLDIPVVDTENPITIRYTNDPNWSKCFSEIKLIVSSAQKLKTTVDKLENVFPSSEIQIVSSEYLFIQDKNNLVSELENLAHKIDSLQNIIGNNSISESINWLSNEIQSNLEQVSSEYTDESDSQITVETFRTDVEKLIENILIIIQNLYKKYQSKEKSETEKEPSQTTEETEQQSNEFEDNHLKSLVVENLFQDISALEIRNIFRKVKKLIEKLYKMNLKDSKDCKTLLSHCVPLLEQIGLLYQYFVTQQVSAYRVTCKLSSVLLNIFIELASKGFCVPQDLSDELDSEGQSNQAGGGMGLGEGEGEKDVSDRIESEDQLEDAQPAGEEKKNEDKDCKEEDKGIEMSEDFESKLQDIDKPDDDKSMSDSDSDAEKQMGDTEQDSNRLDQQIWGSDEENDDNDADEEEQSKQNEEKGEGGELEDQQMAAKEEGNKPNEEEDELQPNSKDKNKEQKKDINEIDEPEYDEDQVDPYHGKQPPLPEPEPMDLPDDLQLDDGEEKEEQDQGEENPFDIDKMKEQMPAEEQSEEKEKDENIPETENNDQNDSDSSDEEEIPPNPDMETEEKHEDQNEDNNEQTESSGMQENQENEEDKQAEEKENENASVPDNQQSKENEIQPMDIDNVEATDNVQTNPNQTQAQKSDSISQEESEDKDGAGQAQMEESDTGHRGEVNATKDNLNAQTENETPQEKRQRPGESDTSRSLGEISEPVKKKLKTIDIQDQDADDEEMDEGAEEGKDADIYQHIKEAKETDTQVIDTATREQAETQKIQNLEDDDTDELKDQTTEMDEDEPELEVADTQKQKSEKTESKSQKKADGKQQQGDIVEEIKDVEIEGDIVDTMTVPRGSETRYHTQYELLSETQNERLSSVQIQNLRNELETQLGTWNEPPPNMEAEQTWEKFSAITSSLARDLSEQLRLVLEPTQASRLRGDFRTGRRINMRKVIPYIASQFRKDKIWLRRTKPSKREYQIVLAIDDSSSMDDNHSKELAFESVALISKALSLLESGQLSVMSFGETTEILHKLTDTFTEKSGVKLLQKFQFQQKKTCVANLVDFVTTMFSDTHTSVPNAKLLIVVSDGRGIFSEGETYVQQAIRRAKFADIFMVFVIIDNPENKNSILDIRMPVFKDGKLLGIKSYLDNFPFSFYIILQDINSLPSVLSDALRQWFELVTNVDK